MASDGDISFEFAYILWGCIGAVLDCTAEFIVILSRNRACLSCKTFCDETLRRIGLKIKETLAQVHGDVPHLRASLGGFEINVKPNDNFVIELCKC